jgi:hypothetical protein
MIGLTIIMDFLQLCNFKGEVPLNLLLIAYKKEMKNQWRDYE